MITPVRFKIIKIEGLEKIVKEINRELVRMKKTTLAGLVRAAIEIRRSTEDKYPKTPVDIGNLRASWFIVTSDARIESEASPGFKSGPGEHKGRVADDAEIALLQGNHPKTLMKARALIFGDKPMVAIGYSAYYAAFVHEMVGNINWGRPQSGAKWFEAHLKGKKNRILSIIAESVGIR